MSVKERNWSRLAELRHFALRNIMFFLALLALFVVLFNLAGGWEVIGMDDITSAWAAWVFLGLSMTVLLILLVLGLKWLFSKRTDIEQSSPDEKTLKSGDGILLDIRSRDFVDMNTEQITAFFKGLTQTLVYKRQSGSVTKKKEK